jgi:hypothetical protein
MLHVPDSLRSILGLHLLRNIGHILLLLLLLQSQNLVMTRHLVLLKGGKGSWLEIAQTCGPRALLVKYLLRLLKMC